MKLYCELLQKNSNIVNIFIPDEKSDSSLLYCSKNGTNINIVQRFIFMHVLYMNSKRQVIFTSRGLHYPSYVKEKYKHIKDNILGNIFTSKQDAECIFDIFSKTQRNVLALNKLLYIYRVKKAKVKINMDLCMNEISPTEKNVFVLLQNKFKYYFIVSDLVNIINRCLMNSPNFFSEPLRSKNPYNNIEFTEADLYNMYFFMKSRLSIVPELIQNFFICGMKLNVFKEKCECLIREVYIHNYIYTSHWSVLHLLIDDMFELSKECTTYLRIHEHFPKDKLVEIMRPYLHLYYIYSFYIDGTSKKENSYYTLKKKLRNFVRFNPHFGRKKITIHKDGTTTFHFNDECIKFNKVYKESELKSIDIISRFRPRAPSRRIDTPEPEEEPSSRQQRFNEDVFSRLTLTPSSDILTDVDVVRAYIYEPYTPVEIPAITRPMSPPRIGMGNNFISLFRTQEPPYSYTSVEWVNSGNSVYSNTGDAVVEYNREEEGEGEGEEVSTIERVNEYSEFDDSQNIYSSDSYNDNNYHDDDTLF